MNITKHAEFFNPATVKENIHIIGCGAVGSTLAFTLAKLGITNFVLYDEDVVESKNIANQMFRAADIGSPKTEAVKKMICEMNPDAERDIKIEGFYTNQKLDGYVFIAVDNIEIRKSIVQGNKFNLNIKAMFDFRMRLEDAQHYAADWSSIEMKDDLFETMDFTHEEEVASTPRSACHEVLSIFYTIMGIVSCGVENFVHFCKNPDDLQKMMIYDTKFHCIDSFPRTDI